MATILDNTAKDGRVARTRSIWGRVAEVDRPRRIIALVFVLVSIASLSFTQLGFWSIGTVDGKPVYLMLVLAPLVMGAMMFGWRIGALLGLFSGAVLYAHATVLPLDYYEIYYMTPLNTFFLMTVLGAVAGWLFTLALRNNPQGGKRIAAIVSVCLALSATASIMLMANTVIEYGGIDQLDALREYLFNSPLGVAIQALIDALLMVLLCCLADTVLTHLTAGAAERTLLRMFRNWMLVVSSIVFMAASAIIFSTATLQEQVRAEASMKSELTYLGKQIVAWDDDELDGLLDGYSPEIDGYAIITDPEGIILASDDERYPIGKSLVKLLGYDPETFETEDGLSAAAYLLESTAEEGVISTIQDTREDGTQTMDCLYFAVTAYDGGYIVMTYPPNLVYADRFGIMSATTLLAILLITAIAIVATALLSSVVIRRIDETNDSLFKITEGNLDERVNVRDTREFSSLSTGINTTVSALKGTIAEVEQKNAQELATAKAIQESALPREFPPFPDIDAFDIYASMKTAKEVGGDFYDFFLIGDNDDKLGFIIADVSGKGIPAALFMMTAKTQLRTYMQADMPLGEAIDAANHQLCIGNDAGMFVTLFACVLNYRTGELTYVNGGHNPPLLLSGGTWEWLRDVSGMPLGLFDGIPYDAFTRQLEVGEVLYLYTDGVTEAMNADGELFSEERLEETLGIYATMNPRSIGVGVRRALTDFTKDAEQSDDITMLAMKYGVPPEKKAVMVLPADVKQLVHVYNFIHEELHRRGAPKSAYNPLDIAAEELFVNVCHYAYPDATPEDPGEVRVSFVYEAAPPSLTVQIADDGIPYDPLAKPDAVTPDDIADVPIGGLGILMAKRSVDEMSYERVGDSNVLTFRKGW